MPIITFSIPTIRVNLAPELASKADLLAYLGMNQKELKKIKWYRARMYHQFSISRDNKKPRIINAPDKRLKYLQGKIAALLNGLYRVRHPVHGFVPNKSVKSNAQAHLRKRYILNMDIKDFFPTITENRIVGLLESLGMQSEVAETIGIVCCLNSRLPQGAPSSPILSNMICFRLDKQLLSFAKRMRCIYTRYADDITFSSHQPMSAIFEGQVPAAGKFPPDLLCAEIQQIFSGNGFALNENKSHYADRHSRRMVTGLKVNELLNVDRKFVRNIRATLYSIETLGLKAAQKKYEDSHSGKSSIEAHLRGKLSWLGFIRGQSDPVYRGLALRFNESFKAKKIEVTPTTEQMHDRAVWVVEHISDDASDLAQGSAFFLKDAGLITAAHCVKGVSEVDIYHPSKPSNVFKTKIVKSCEDRDLALLNPEIPINEYYELELSGKAPVVGDEMVALGYPSFGPGDRLNVRNGNISSLPTKSAVKKIEVTQKLAQGMSGGPLLDDTNRVAGVIHKGGPHEARDFAISTEVLVDWLAE